MKQIKEIAFLVYPVREPKTAKRFYTDVLGFKETANWQDQWIEFDIGSGTLAITNGFTQIQPGAKGAMAAGMEEKKVHPVQTHEEAVQEVEKIVREGDWILVKGSRRMHMERIVEKLRESLGRP